MVIEGDFIDRIFVIIIFYQESIVDKDSLLVLESVGSNEDD